MQFQNIKATKMIYKVIAGKAPNRSNHANLVTLSPFLCQKAANFTKLVIEALLNVGN